jgi:hypothetical protein
MSSPYDGLPPGHIVVKRQLYYRLVNLTGGQINYPVTINVLSHTGEHNLRDSNGEPLTLPRIREVSVNRVPVTLTNDQRASYSKTEALPKMDKETQAWEIYSEVEEVSTMTDRALYILAAPCYGLELQVINQIPALVTLQEDNVYLTSGRERLRLTTPQKWTCDGGILSGSALSLSWKVVAKKNVTSPKGTIAQEAAPPGLG